jgi:hypothetical protein
MDVHVPDAGYEETVAPVKDARCRGNRNLCCRSRVNDLIAADEYGLVCQSFARLNINDLDVLDCQRRVGNTDSVGSGRLSCASERHDREQSGC